VLWHSTRPARLLLVEDNPADAMLLRTALREVRTEYRLHVATDGEDAMQYLLKDGPSAAENRPDLILLDLNLPKVDGHQVLQMVKTNKDLRAIPVVVLTSSLAPSDIAMAYARGANSYLEKPSDIEKVFDLVRTLKHYWLDLSLLPG
jgi:CheY-like chemotaxis protein